MAIVLNGTTGITTPGLINSGDSTVTGNTTFSSSSYVGIGLTPTSRDNAHLQLIDGIGFPATQVSSSDANVLDDYEEGTWTPYVNGTVALQTSRYVKIGQIVFCEVVSYSANISSIGTTTPLYITGLPFAMNSYQYCMPCGQQAGVTFGIFDGSGTTAPLGQGGTAQDYQSVTRNTFGGTGTLSFRFSFTYRTTN